MFGSMSLSAGTVATIVSVRTRAADKVFRSGSLASPGPSPAYPTRSAATSPSASPIPATPPARAGFRFLQPWHRPHPPRPEHGV